jgi:hypothetical protein
MIPCHMTRSFSHPNLKPEPINMQKPNRSNASIIINLVKHYRPSNSNRAIKTIDHGYEAKNDRRH